MFVKNLENGIAYGNVVLRDSTRRIVRDVHGKPVVNPYAQVELERVVNLRVRKVSPGRTALLVCIPLTGVIIWFASTWEPIPKGVTVQL